MTAATQGYISPINLESNNISFAGLSGIEKSNNQILRNCSRSANTMGQPRSGLSQNLENQQQQQQRSSEYSRGLMSDDISSFFDFDHQTSSDPRLPSQFPSMTNPSMGSGWNSISFDTLTPPNSAIFASEEWPPYQLQGRQPQNIVTNVYSTDTRMQHGQTTPPDGEDCGALEYEGTQRQVQPALASSAGSAKKRKRTSAATNEVVSPPKRTRKNSSRSNSAHSSNPLSDPNNPEEIRRNKFLERNRLAASKCRQKKKEWTSNLETRARELQKNNSSLRIMLSSLKDEILWLKGEMLKHSSCGCEQIQALIKQRADDFAEHHDADAVTKKEQSPIGTAPHSRQNSISLGSDQGTTDQATSPTVQGSPAPMSLEDHDLEALLTSQFVHDTSDHGIAQQVRAAN